LRALLERERRESNPLTLEGSSAWLRKAGFAGYLEKPIDIEEFPAQVRRYCR
jgi:hypothetical protein